MFVFWWFFVSFFWCFLDFFFFVGSSLSVSANSFVGFSSSCWFYLIFHCVRASCCHDSPVRRRRGSISGLLSFLRIVQFWEVRSAVAWFEKKVETEFLGGVHELCWVRGLMVFGVSFFFMKISMKLMDTVWESTRKAAFFGMDTQHIHSVLRCSIAFVFGSKNRSKKTTPGWVFRIRFWVVFVWSKIWFLWSFVTHKRQILMVF